MAKKYAHPTKDIVLSGLKKGHSILDMMLWNEDWHEPSRAAVKMTSLWLLYHEVYFKLDTMLHWTNAPDIQSVKDSLEIVEDKFKLFGYSKRKRLFLPIRPKETDEQLKLRMQRTIRNRVALGWVVRDLIEQYGNDKKAHPRVVISSHTNREFMDQVRCSEPTVTRYLNQMVEEGYVLRYEGNGRKKSYFVRPDRDEDYEEMMPNMDSNYEPHKPTHPSPAQREAWEADSQPLDKELLDRLLRRQMQAQKVDG
jgi:hypothetical protein